MTSSSPTPPALDDGSWHCVDRDPHEAHIVTSDDGAYACRGVPAAQQPLSRDDPLRARIAAALRSVPTGRWHISAMVEAIAPVITARDAGVRADERRRVAEELDQARADLAAVQSAIVRLHVQMPDHVAPRLGFEASDLCRADGERWPCPTIRALRPAAPAERVQDAPTDTAGTPEEARP